MPFECHVDPAAERGTIVVRGVVDIALFLDMMRALYLHPAWKPGFQALWDARDISQLLLSPHDTERVVALMRDLDPQMGNGRAAFVVSREIDYIIARLLIYRGLDSQRERRTFVTIEEAEAWLDEGADGTVRATG